MTHASYVAVIRRAADGLERRADMPFEWAEDGDLFWWSDGNYGCDCNRYLVFERAGGVNPLMDDPACVCGDGAYLVIRFEFPDGSHIAGPDA